MKSALGIEILEILNCNHIDRARIRCIEFYFGVILYPLIFKGLFSRYAILGFEGQHLINEIFGTLANMIPFWRWKSELSLLYPLEDKLIVFSIKRRIATEENVENHTTTPHIALLVVLSS